MPQAKMTPLKGQLIKAQAEATPSNAKWMKDTRYPTADMVLFNGNHRWTHMEELYEQEFHDYYQGMKDPKNFMPEHKQNEAMDLMKALQAATNSSLLLHELTVNQSLSSRDDTDTDKLKNDLWLGRGKGSDIADELITDVVEKWEKSKDSTSSNTAWVVSNKQLFNFLQDIYAHLPMLILLEFLVSPVILPTMEQVTTRYLSKDCIGIIDPKQETEHLWVIKDMLVYYKNNPDDKCEKTTLFNIVTKMMWWRLCFDLSLGDMHPSLLQTRPPILSVSAIAARMLNWHACKMLKYMKVPRGELEIEEVTFFDESLREIFT
ncbi:hypothetical protein EV702DRAFT_1044812 [Suillus placidus]|uniref:Uncharacterized protein n=1 Tax=Suillus placidus TaxID=48579 RepID=A0A9P6ZXT1_9AGAM|nr:hypothetical protein EV702DRAFT_1044812 [Suillus placidus]